MSALRETELLSGLMRRELPVPEIGPAIVRLAKSLVDRQEVAALKPAVAQYLDHPDDWVRHEAVWYLGVWARAREYEAILLEVAAADRNPDIRSFAAFGLGKLCRGGQASMLTVQTLARMVEDETQDRLLRLSAYGSLLEIVRGVSDLDFVTYDKDLPDVDWEWVRSLGSPE